MRLIALLLPLLAPLLPAQAQTRPDYAPGQVWEYRNRPQDQGSLLRIQQVEKDASGEPIYHISLTGVTLREYPDNPIGHLPVSRKTLDASVTRLSASTAAFPDPSEGIGQWRAAKGGVFTLPVARIVDVIEQSLPE